MVIRDNVYGDIEIPAKFVELINTREFQRLRRIKQLATAEQVFPGAVHSRFSHSIGVFHVMKKIMEHFERTLKSIGQEAYINEEEKDVILAAALLHDVGHGPFSHAFEHAKIFGKTYTHEEWTKRIITGKPKAEGTSEGKKTTEINQVLQNWGADVPERVGEYIDYRTAAKKEGEGISEIQRGVLPDFKFIFTSLVSSQLDADRMDYLLRDSFNCGVNFGKFDLDNLIAGLSIGINGEGKFRVCVKKNYLANVEEYFFARYQMYRNIYLHPYKVLSETLLEKILNRACDYYLHEKLPADMIPPLMRKIFNCADMSLEDYIQLDDTVVMGAIHMWSHLDISDIWDLKRLCECFLYRSGYKQILLTDVDAFLKEFDECLKEEAEGKWKKDLIFIKCANKVKMYDRTGTNPVYILLNDGKINKLEDVSGLVGEEKEEQTIYYNEDFCKDNPSVTESVRKLLQDYDIRKSLEIENKYILAKDVYPEIVKVLKDKEYQIEEREAEGQTDYYFDTKEMLLYKNNCTLRIRNKGEKYWVTIKTPSDSESNGEAGQLERNEIEREVDGLKLETCEDMLCRYMGSFLKEHTTRELFESIIIVNSRKKVIATKTLKNEFIHEEKYEIVFDDVQYQNRRNDARYKELQMEIELKSPAETRINMKGLTDELERKIEGLEKISDSKYHRAVDFTIKAKLEKTEEQPK